MIDLSNNNGAVDFRRVHAAGIRRVYLKATEGAGFVDKTHIHRRVQAQTYQLLTGEYHFARPSQSSPRVEAEHFLSNLPEPLRKGRDLRPCLDLEDPDTKAAPRVGRWAQEFIRYVQRHREHVCLIYGSPYYLEACQYPVKGTPLWLASYGRNDGKEYPFKVPRPWTHVAAHQFASTARVPGVEGHCDVSRVLHPHEIDVAVTR